MAPGVCRPGAGGEANREGFESAMKTVDATFQNLDSSEISLTDVSHYFDSDPTKLVRALLPPRHRRRLGRPAGPNNNEFRMRFEDCVPRTTCSGHVPASIGCTHQSFGHPWSSTAQVHT